MKNKCKRIALLLTAPLAMAVFTSLRCPEVDPVDHIILLPNPDDCNSFFACSNGVPIMYCCPQGLWFNSKLGVCDWPKNLDQEALEACGGSSTGGGGGGSGNGNWQGKRLEMVKCSCIVNNERKDGKSLRCRPTGDLEACSATQQGSNACYKVNLSGMRLQCEGNVTFEGE